MFSPGPGKGYTIGQYGTGGSYGGEGGAESASHPASPAYGSFSKPSDFGSGGGTGNGYKGTLFSIDVKDIYLIKKTTSVKVKDKLSTD